MSGGKSPQPLFELLAKGQSDALTRRAKAFIPGAEAAGQAAVGPSQGGPARADQGAGGQSATSGSPGASHSPSASMPAPPTAAAVQPSGRESAGGSKPSRFGSQGQVTIPMVGVYVGAAIAVALLVVTWTIGYGRGAAAGEREWQAEILASRAGNIGADPLIDPSVGGKGTETSGAPQSRQDRTRTAQREESPSTGGLSSGLANAARAGVLSSAGVLPSDPRQPGQNYLKLAVLSRADAEHAIAYLRSGGVEAIGVPVVDPGAGAGKNPSRYEVFATVGITGEEYRNNRPVRTELEAKVARIGERYRREAKGATDFGKPLWMKYNP